VLYTVYRITGIHILFFADGKLYYMLRGIPGGFLSSAVVLAVTPDPAPVRNYLPIFFWAAVFLNLSLAA
jgi:hypothetical protein